MVVWGLAQSPLLCQWLSCWNSWDIILTFPCFWSVFQLITRHVMELHSGTFLFKIICQSGINVMFSKCRNLIIFIRPIKTNSFDWILFRIVQSYWNSILPFPCFWSVFQLITLCTCHGITQWDIWLAVIQKRTKNVWHLVWHIIRIFSTQVELQNWKKKTWKIFGLV